MEFNMYADGLYKQNMHVKSSILEANLTSLAKKMFPFPDGMKHCVCCENYRSWKAEFIKLFSEDILLTAHFDSFIATRMAKELVAFTFEETFHTQLGKSLWELDFLKSPKLMQVLQLLKDEGQFEVVTEMIYHCYLNLHLYSQQNVETRVTLPDDALAENEHALHADETLVQKGLHSQAAPSIAVPADESLLLSFFREHIPALLHKLDTYHAWSVTQRAHYFDRLYALIDVGAYLPNQDPIYDAVLYERAYCKAQLSIQDIQHFLRAAAPDVDVVKVATNTYHFLLEQQPIVSVQFFPHHYISTRIVNEIELPNFAASPYKKQQVAILRYLLATQCNLMLPAFIVEEQEPHTEITQLADGLFWHVDGLNAAVRHCCQNEEPHACL